MYGKGGEGGEGEEGEEGGEGGEGGGGGEEALVPVRTRLERLRGHSSNFIIRV